ncbi:MAG: recombination protein RecR [Rickettsiaceae bacterium]|jgi:recombination protein RecR|nr:recombination protein RecR [Rickettsiaceae bacterium]
MIKETSGPDQLIYLFSKLPGLGTRSARRIVLHLLQDKDLRLKGLIEGLQDAAAKINCCTICNNIDYNLQCRICRDQQRNDNIIAVVETVAELWAIERTGHFKGRYHVLGGTLSSSANRSPADLKLPSLLSRCNNHQTKELIIATNSTLDGQTTAYFITEYFKDYPIKTSRLASGIPIGGELDYLDEGTLWAAFESRKPFE